MYVCASFVRSALSLLLPLHFHCLRRRRVAFPWMVFLTVRCIFSSFSFRLLLLLLFSFFLLLFSVAFALGAVALCRSAFDIGIAYTHTHNAHVLSISCCEKIYVCSQHSHCVCVCVCTKQAGDIVFSGWAWPFWKLWTVIGKLIYIYFAYVYSVLCTLHVRAMYIIDYALHPPIRLVYVCACASGRACLLHMLVKRFSSWFSALPWTMAVDDVKFCFFLPFYRRAPQLSQLLFQARFTHTNVRQFWLLLLLLLSCHCKAMQSVNATQSKAHFVHLDNLKSFLLHTINVLPDSRENQKNHNSKHKWRRSRPAKRNFLRTRFADDKDLRDLFFCSVR